jgi:hypothetical protein
MDAVSWGFTAVQDAKTKKYHAFADTGCYTPSSVMHVSGFQLPHMVSDSPLGPFTATTLAAPPTHFNPHAYHFDDGSATGIYVLYTNGGTFRETLRQQQQSSNHASAVVDVDIATVVEGDGSSRSRSRSRSRQDCTACCVSCDGAKCCPGCPPCTSPTGEYSIYTTVSAGRGGLCASNREGRLSYHISRTTPTCVPACLPAPTSRSGGGEGRGGEEGTGQSNAP